MVALSDVDSAGDKGPDFATSSHSPRRRLLWCRTARDGKFFFHRETDKFQRRHLLCLLKALYRTSTTGPRRVVVITDMPRYHHARLHRNWRRNTRTDSSSTICRRTAQISTRSNGFASFTRRKCLHNRYFRYSARSSIPSRPNSRSGYAATLPCVAYGNYLGRRV